VLQCNIFSAGVREERKPAISDDNVDNQNNNKFSVSFNLTQPYSPNITISSLISFKSNNASGQSVTLHITENKFAVLVFLC
jgi:hypothetical protein